MNTSVGLDLFFIVCEEEAPLKTDCSTYWNELLIHYSTIYPAYPPRGEVGVNDIIIIITVPYNYSLASDFVVEVFRLLLGSRQLWSERYCSPIQCFPDLLPGPYGIKLLS
jgi:hypothetical protein